jgi:hypothetical protein
MSEVFEHNLGDHEDPLTGPTWIVGFLGAVLLTVITLGLTALFYNAKRDEEQAKVIHRDPMELLNLQSEQHARIADPPRWVEREIRVEGSEKPQVVRTLTIPIDHAMQLVVNEQGQQTQAPAR